MANREQWLALAARCEQATGADREIDKEIVAALGYSWRGMAYWDNATSTKTLPGSGFYTHSIDAITALIARKLPGFGVASRRNPEPGPHCCRAAISSDDCKVPPDGFGTTEALARCAAFCRAMAERGE